MEARAGGGKFPAREAEMDGVVEKSPSWPSFSFPNGPLSAPLRADEKVKADENKKGGGLERNCRIIKNKEHFPAGWGLPSIRLQNACALFLAGGFQWLDNFAPREPL